MCDDDAGKSPHYLLEIMNLARRLRACTLVALLRVPAEHCWSVSGEPEGGLYGELRRHANEEAPIGPRPRT